MMSNKNRRALSLFSGGLDSLLSILWMKRLGYEVIPVFFRSHFFGSEKAEHYAGAAGLELRVVDISDDLIEVLRNPRYGFGKNMNPCIDCHSLMFRRAGRMMEKEGIDFLISGEVLGQRPMSQRLDAMNAVKKHSGYGDYIIRPLSQKLLPDTKPIREGWVRKDELLDIQGRGRHRQLEMVKEFDLEDFSNPGGGCLLTDRGYSLRLRDLFKHDMTAERYIKFLRFGRHFRINDDVKLVMGRNSTELSDIFELVTDETVLRAANHQGPIGVINSKRELNEEEIRQAAEIVLSYTNRASENDLIVYGLNNDFHSEIEVHKLPRERIVEMLINISNK